VFRFSYESLVTQSSVFDYDLNTRSRTLLKQEEILGGYDPSRYRSSSSMPMPPMARGFRSRWCTGATCASVRHRNRCC
jgi:hypothetical protein